ncbi:hypothetical protein [Flammeovirga agarivorans]|uniref:Outer membrane protein beta-barrel domain-containing protein n=1 Tax=Flammeovirga agarivorans TaxID=2726742 RepID=A0A7X8SGV5_9BACT|nr:hypothetical protein [Flammeovirga agarivorans]NLR89965.1 hypothetical protein [Flammeovirga agarivorans]
MKKLTLTFFFILGIILTCQAQFRMGLGGGVTNLNNKSENGETMGAYFFLAPTYQIQPKLDLLFQVDVALDLSGTEADMMYTSLTPIVRYYPWESTVRPFIHGGVGAFITPEKTLDYGTVIEDKNAVDFGVKVGFGFLFKAILVSCNYSSAYTTFVDSSSKGYVDLSVGFRF